jgi:hypothetical protein
LRRIGGSTIFNGLDAAGFSIVFVELLIFSLGWDFCWTTFCGTNIISGNREKRTFFPFTFSFWAVADKIAFVFVPGGKMKLLLLLPCVEIGILLTMLPLMFELLRFIGELRSSK